jgi:hypothetical protein
MFKLNNIAAEKNSTIVFPLPIEVLSNFMNYTTAKIDSINTKNNLIRKTIANADIASYSPPNSNIYQDDLSLANLQTQSEMNKPAVKKFKTKLSPKDSTDL